jgi:DNA-binding Lrp family transcriptional regulator
VLSELARYFSPCEDRRPGDLDLKQIADYYGIGEEWARKTAYRLVERGVLVKVYVKNPNGRKMLVFRKV